MNHIIFHQGTKWRRKRDHSRWPSSGGWPGSYPYNWWLGGWKVRPTEPHTIQWDKNTSLHPTQERGYIQSTAHGPCPGDPAQNPLPSSIHQTELANVTVQRYDDKERGRKGMFLNAKMQIKCSYFRWIKH